MEQEGMHSQHFTHQQAVHMYGGNTTFDILQSPLCGGTFPELVGGDSKPAQPPRPSPPYGPQHHSLDRGAPLDVQGSPSTSYSTPGRPQQRGHAHLRYAPPPPQLQQPQPRPAAAYPSFPQAHHEAHHPMTQAFPSEISRDYLQYARMPVDPWGIDPFVNNSSAQYSAPQGGLPRLFESMYPSHQQPRYPLSTTHPQAVVHAPPERSQATIQNAGSGPPTFHDQQNEDSSTTDHPQPLRSWGGAGSLDPATGVFSRAADHPRIRTAQACEKCRARKAKCSGEHPTCQRCLTRGLICAYAAERRMRGPNKPKPPPPPLPDSSQSTAEAGQKTRKRASTLPSAPPQNSQMWGQQQRHNSRQEQGVVAASSPASSAGSGSLGYPPLSESEASPMTPHSSLEGRHPQVVGFPPSPHMLVQEYPKSARRGMLGHANEVSNHDDTSATATTGGSAIAGVYGQDIFPGVRMSLDSTKNLF